MYGDFTRSIPDRARRYTGVRSQQGRVILDEDMTGDDGGRGRNRFFSGKTLSADDLRSEQSYEGKRRARRCIVLGAIVVMLSYSLRSCLARRGVRIAAVYVEGERWRSVDSLDDAGPDDAVYTLDRGTSTLRFGDGVHGRVPPAGSNIRVEYRTGHGSAGNVPT